MVTGLAQLTFKALRHTSKLFCFLRERNERAIIKSKIQAPHQAHRSRTRRRPRPREGLLLGIRAGIVSVCPFRIAPRVCGVGDAFSAEHRRAQAPRPRENKWGQPVARISHDRENFARGADIRRGEGATFMPDLSLNLLERSASRRRYRQGR